MEKNDVALANKEEAPPLKKMRTYVIKALLFGAEKGIENISFQKDFHLAGRVLRFSELFWRLGAGDQSLILDSGLIDEGKCLQDVNSVLCLMVKV